jgi:hypothetical protein
MASVMAAQRRQSFNLPLHRSPAAKEILRISSPNGKILNCFRQGANAPLCKAQASASCLVMACASAESALPSVPSGALKSGNDMGQDRIVVTMRAAGDSMTPQERRRELFLRKREVRLMHCVLKEIVPKKDSFSWRII